MARHDGRYPTKYPWPVIGADVQKAYRAGESPATLERVHGVPKGAIASYIQRTIGLRTKKEAKQVERDVARGRVYAPRVCIACTQPFTPASPRHKLCVTCIPNRAASGRYASKGVTQPNVDAIVTAQGGTCALCSNTATDVDHNHKTLVVRGILCGGCNLALNRIECAGWAARAEAYLQRDTGFRTSAVAQVKYDEQAQRWRAKPR